MAYKIPTKSKKPSRSRKKKNPISYEPGQKEIIYYKLLDGLSKKVEQILLEGIYGRYYYKQDVKDNRDFRYLENMITMFEKHIREYIGEMSQDEVLEYVSFIREAKKLPNNILVILPQEFTRNDQPYYDALKDAKKSTRVNPKCKRNPSTPTSKENMISAIGTGCMDIGKLIVDPTMRLKLQNLPIEDLQRALVHVDQLLWFFKKLQIGFVHFGEKAGLR